MMFIPSPKPAEPTHAEAEDAAKLLGVHLEGLTQDRLAEAYRRVVRSIHPDTAGENAALEFDVRDVQHARNVLVRWILMQPDPDCRSCKGKGVIPGRMGTVKPCERCG